MSMRIEAVKEEYLNQVESTENGPAFVSFGGRDSVEVWQAAGLKPTGAEIYSGGVVRLGYLKPVLSQGVTVLSQDDGKRNFVMAGSVEEENHFSLTDVAEEAASAERFIPSMPLIPNIKGNPDVASRARADWEQRYDTLLHKSEHVGEALQNSGERLLLDSKPDVVDLIETENRKIKKAKLDGQLEHLDKEFGKEVKSLENSFVTEWTGVKREDTVNQKTGSGKWGNVVTAVGVIASAPIPYIDQQTITVLEDLQDGYIGGQPLGNEEYRQRVDQNETNTEIEKSRAKASFLGVGLTAFDRTVDHVIPDTPQSQINQAAEILGIDPKDERLEEGETYLGSVAYRQAKERGESDEDAGKALWAAARGFFKGSDGKWHQTWGTEPENIPVEQTEETVNKETSPQALVKATVQAFAQGFWGDALPASPAPSESAPNTQPNPSQNTETNPATSVPPATETAVPQAVKDNISLLFSGNSDTGKTVVMMNNPEPFGNQISPDIRDRLAYQVAEKLLRTLQANPNLQKVVIPGVEVVDPLVVLTKLQELDSSVRVPSITSHAQGADFESEGELTVALHVNANGESVAEVWDNPVLQKHDSDGSYFMQGLLHVPVQQSDGTWRLNMIPAQQIENGRIDIRHINGQEIKVRVDLQSEQLQSVWNPLADNDQALFDNPDLAWIDASEVSGLAVIGETNQGNTENQTPKTAQEFNSNIDNVKQQVVTELGVNVVQFQDYPGGNEVDAGVYGLDQYNRAVVKYNQETKRFEKYDRKIFKAYPGNNLANQSDVDKFDAEIDPALIVPLKDRQGNVIPTGHILSVVRDGIPFNLEIFSCVVVGEAFPSKNGRVHYVPCEIQTPFTRMQIYFRLEGVSDVVPDSAMWQRFKIPTSNQIPFYTDNGTSVPDTSGGSVNIMNVFYDRESNMTMMKSEEITAFKKSEMVGRTIIVGTEAGSLQESQYNPNLEKVVAAIRTGNVSQDSMFIAHTSWLWVPEDVID